MLLDNGVTCWALSPAKYVQEAVSTTPKNNFKENSDGLLQTMEPVGKRSNHTPRGNRPPKEGYESSRLLMSVQYPYNIHNRYLCYFICDVRLI